MDCRRFEHALAEALADPAPAPPEVVETLRVHADACASCAGALDLVTLAALPVEERDAVAEPPPSVWERIDRGIARRRRVHRSTRVGLAAAAAVAGLALVAVVMGFVSGPSGGDGSVREAVADAVPAAPWAGIEPMDPVEFSLGPDGAVEDEAWPAGGWEPFPEVEGLDERGRADLLRWLKDEEKRLRGEDSA